MISGKPEICVIGLKNIKLKYFYSQHKSNKNIGRNKFMRIGRVALVTVM
jgi:hypothetical protein